MCLAMAQIQDGFQEKSLRKQLAATIRNIQWSYAIFWANSPTQQGVLAWGDGYYNGDIKTRKTTQPMEFKADQIGLQRSEQLRELYDSLSTEDINQQTKRPSASLSPEDLTATEWYYLVCMSFTFSPGQGLPGRALASNQHIWVSSAHFADNKTFSRALLAKSALIQTVVCFPFMDGVLELGTTEQVPEDPGLIHQVTSRFWELPLPVGSEQSISNSPPPEKDEEESFRPILNQDPENMMALDNHNLISGHQSQLENVPLPFAYTLPSYTPNDETEQNTNIHEELQNGSPDLSSNDSFKLEELIATSQGQSCLLVDDCMSIANTPTILSSPKGARTDYLQEGNFTSLDLGGDETHYKSTLSSLLQNSKGPGSMLFFLNGSRASSFTIWRRNMNSSKFVGGTSQKMLKKILVDTSWIKNEKYEEEDGLKNKGLKTEGDDVGANHVLSERRRREKLNEKFLILRSLVPSISKVDKASILGDTIEYLKELERRVEELESCKEIVELNARERRKHPDLAERTSDNYGNNENTNRRKPLSNKRKASSIDQEAEAEHDQLLVSKNGAVEINITMIEKEVTLEMNCPWRDRLLLEIVDAISNLHLDAHSVQSSNVDGALILTLKAKCRDLVVVSPGMVKRALQRIVGKC